MLPALNPFKSSQLGASHCSLYTSGVNHFGLFPRVISTSINLSSFAYFILLYELVYIFTLFTFQNVIGTC